MRPLRILKRSIGSAFKSVFRNLNLSIAAISCIVITLILVSCAIILTQNVNKSATDIENDLTIVVFVKKDATKEDMDELEKNIKAIPNVVTSKVTLVSKEEVKEAMQKENKTFKSIMDEWDEDENPLQAYFIVPVEKLDEISETTTTIENLENVHVANYGGKVADQLLSTFDVIKKVMIVAVAALVFVTAFLISNTIKITIYSRKNEIDIMRLVGTSNSVIRLPFLFEGLFLGIFGSIIPIIVTIYGYVFLYDKMDGVLFTKMLPLISPYNFVFKVSLFLVLIGAVVGMFGSYRAVRKYLKI